MTKIDDERIRMQTLCQYLSDPELLEIDYLAEKTKCNVNE